MKVVPTGGALGAEIQGVDLTNGLDDETVAHIRQALLDYCVIYFRDQGLSEEDQIRFTNYFGQAVEHVRKQRERKNKEIFLISNVKENGEEIGALGSH